MKLFLVLSMLVVYGVCIPCYKKLNPHGFKWYTAWCTLIGVIWLYLLLFTNVIAR